jgi:hypothetical protein
MLILTSLLYLHKIFSDILLSDIQLSIWIFVLDILEEEVTQNVEISIIMMSFGKAIIELPLNHVVVEN